MYVSFTGGRPYQVAKINIMNLNKQAKLFSQGMHPVIRVGENGKWERIKEKPVYFVSIQYAQVKFPKKPLTVGKGGWFVKGGISLY